MASTSAPAAHWLLDNAALLAEQSHAIAEGTPHGFAAAGRFAGGDPAPERAGDGGTASLSVRSGTDCG